jgi:hypothetical protein
MSIAKNTSVKELQKQEVLARYTEDTRISEKNKSVHVGSCALAITIDTKQPC